MLLLTNYLQRRQAVDGGDPVITLAGAPSLPLRLPHSVPLSKLTCRAFYCTIVPKRGS